MSKTKEINSTQRRWRIHTTLESKALRITRAELSRIIREVLKQISSEIAIPEVNEIHVMIINDARMREINREFRDKDKATDVLSFPQYTPQEIRQGIERPGVAGSYLGDLVISSETTLRQAKRYGVTRKRELLRLIVHGVLHLIGYDHEGVPAKEAQAMRRRERQVSEQLS